MCRFNYLLLSLMVFLLFSPLTKRGDLQQNYDLFDFQFVELQQYTNILAKRLCCSQCQNQNLQEFNAQAAKGFKLKMNIIANQCSSNQEIKDYLVALYWSVVLHWPPFNYSTALHRIFLLLFLIFFVLYSIRMIKRN